MLLNVLVIGYRNHARHLIELCARNSYVSRVTVYVKLGAVFDLSELSEFRGSEKVSITRKLNFEDCDCVFVCSPSSTHIGYLKQIIAESPSNVQIYCEKPPCLTSSDLDYLRDLPKGLKRRVYFGFNWRFSALNDYASRECAQGDLHMFYYQLTHGLAYKKTQVDWRFSSEYVLERIAGNLGIHVVDLFMRAVGEIPKVKIEEFSFAVRGIADTASITLNFVEKNIIGFVFLSYAGPASEKLVLNKADKIVEVDCLTGNIHIQSPRDVFDDHGRFKAADRKMVNNGLMSDKGLEICVKSFLTRCAERTAQPLVDFEDGLRATSLFVDEDHIEPLEREK